MKNAGCPSRKNLNHLNIHINALLISNEAIFDSLLIIEKNYFGDDLWK